MGETTARRAFHTFCEFFYVVLSVVDIIVEVFRVSLILC